MVWWNKRMTNITIVTALFDLNREALTGGFARPFQQYIDAFKKLLVIDQPMIIYTEKKVEAEIWKIRKPANTRVIIKDLDHFRQFPFYKEIQQIRNDPTWNGQAEWLANSTQSRLELYNCLVMSKFFFLNDSAITNPFNTEKFLWLDGGLSQTVNIDTYLNNSVFNLLEKELNRMLFVAFPYNGQNEVHGFRKDKMNEFAGQDTEYVCRGGIFGGDKATINQMNGIYYELLSRSLNQGWMGTEESIFTIISYQYPELCNVRFIESNGLVYKYLEDVIKGKYKQINNGLVFYVLTYNLPKQFELWLKHTVKMLGDRLNSIKIICINNSNDPSVKDEYDKLCAKYNIEQISFDNIGINSARIYVGKHFDESVYSHYLFFEDDFLLNSSSESDRCKFGFNTYDNDIFEKSIAILENEKLDYLKLNFSEFFGDNSDNWAWYNVGNEGKVKYFGTNKKDKKTKVEKIDSYKGVPYAIGEYHYCNWPILFSKSGNKKIFIHMQHGNAYEQKMMADVFKRMRDKKDIRAGCLLMTIVTHNRVYHYDGKTRRENSSYSN